MVLQQSWRVGSSFGKLGPTRTSLRDWPTCSSIVSKAVHPSASCCPWERERAAAYWKNVLDSTSRGERVLIVAEEEATGVVVGTVQVILIAPENQPHRGEIAKMLVHRRARRRGVAEALMGAVEAAAQDAGKALLVLDTSSADAERLYDRLGWQRVGVIPGYALWPAGGLVDTTVFYKNLG